MYKWNVCIMGVLWPLLYVTQVTGLKPPSMYMTYNKKVNIK
jgi:hypothetical protein